MGACCYADPSDATKPIRKLKMNVTELNRCFFGAVTIGAVLVLTGCGSEVGDPLSPETLEPQSAVGAGRAGDIRWATMVGA